MNKSNLSNNKFLKANAKVLIIAGVCLVLFLIIIWYAKCTWNTPESTKPSDTNLQIESHAGHPLSLEILNNVIKTEYPKIRQLDGKQITDKIDELQLNNKAQIGGQMNAYEYVYNLVDAAIIAYNSKILDLKKDGVTEFIPPLGNYMVDACIKSKFNLGDKDEITEIGSGAYGIVYKINSNGRTYAIKVIDVTDITYYYQHDNLQGCGTWNQYYTINDVIEEAKISRKLGELGVGPRIYDVYYCKYAGKIKYYFVMDYMNKGSLEDYMRDNNLKVLPEKDINKIIAKLNTLHRIGYLHGDLGKKNILVNQTQSGELEFYIADYGLSNSISSQSKKERDSLYNSLHCDFDDFDKILEKQTEYITKYILSRFTVSPPF